MTLPTVPAFPSSTITGGDDMSVLQIAGFCLVSVVVMSAVLAIFTVTRTLS